MKIRLYHGGPAGDAFSCGIEKMTSKHITDRIIADWNFLKESKRNVIYTILIFLFFFPLSLRNLDVVAQLICRYIGFMQAGVSVLAIMYELYQGLRSKHYSRLLALILIFELSFAISSFLNDDIVKNINTWIVNYLPIAGFVAISDHAMRKDSIQFSKSLRIILGTMCILNGIIMIMAPNGITISHEMSITVNDRIHLLGSDNILPKYFLAAMFAIGIDTGLTKRRLSIFDYLVLFSILASLAYTFCVTGIVACIILAFGLYYIDSSRQRSRSFRYVTKYRYIVIAAIAFAAALFLNHGQETRLMVKLGDLIGKGESIKTRFTIWNSAIEQIIESPFWGKGPSAIASTLWGIDWYSHNGFLDIALKAGGISLASFLSILYYSSKGLYRNKENSIATYIGIALSSLIVMSLVEGILDAKLLYLFAYAFNVDQIISASRLAERPR